MIDFANALENQINDFEMIVQITRVRRSPKGDAYQQPRHYVNPLQVKEHVEEADFEHNIDEKGNVMLCYAREV